MLVENQKQPTSILFMVHGEVGGAACVCVCR